ncbi:MAG: hypothetical protein JJU29_17185 [Verrucomicrobia bacterium]|nr:hypothetical protein [Verrucomicrobiota bacterium]MCH8513545.1 hypothetical protein [Kiritimatiellia bacterium]
MKWHKLYYSFVCMLLASCVSQKSPTRRSLYIHHSGYRYEAYENLFEERQDYKRKIDEMFGLSLTESPDPSAVVHVSTLTGEQFLKLVLNRSRPSIAEYENIDLLSFVEMVSNGVSEINKTLPFEVFVVVRLPEGVRLNDINAESIKKGHLDARGVSEKINHGVVHGELDERLYPFQMASLKKATVLDIAKIIEYVYDFKLVVGDHYIILSRDVDKRLSDEF